MKKQEKALEYAKEAWGVYFDDKHPDIAIEFTHSQISQTDYLAGYNQALKDYCAPEMLEMLKTIRRRYNIQYECEKEIDELIIKATTI